MSTDDSKDGKAWSFSDLDLDDAATDWVHLVNGVLPMYDAVAERTGLTREEVLQFAMVHMLVRIRHAMTKEPPTPGDEWKG